MQDQEKILSALHRGEKVPLLRWVMGDTHTPVRTFYALREKGAKILLESVLQGERWGRYSFLGVRPRRTFRWLRDGTVVIHNSDGRKRTVKEPYPFSILREESRQKFLLPDPTLPRLLGGYMGYVGYGMVSFWEPTVPDNKEEPTPFPEALFYEIHQGILFDHLTQKMGIFTVLYPDEKRSPLEIFQEGEEEITLLFHHLESSRNLPIEISHSGKGIDFAPMISRHEFEEAVSYTREQILKGEAIQVVISQRFLAPFRGDPFLLYRALRVINPSPYLFYFEMDEGSFIGSSPEILVRKEGNRAIVRPIAGTRKRGKTIEEDLLLEKELLQDPKERAEHIMLLDLGRNDLGRVSEPSSVKVTASFVIERYSHVIHLVSQVESTLRKELDFLDLLRASFPAGTVTGAPKVRAMQLIEEVEKVRRGPYAGALGYVNYQGDMDFCILIRTLFHHGETLIAHTGAGIVADSEPGREYEETVNKAMALFKTVDLLKGIEGWLPSYL